MELGDSVNVRLVPQIRDAVITMLGDWAGEGGRVPPEKLAPAVFETLSGPKMSPEVNLVPIQTLLQSDAPHLGKYRGFNDLELMCPIHGVGFVVCKPCRHRAVIETTVKPWISPPASLCVSNTGESCCSSMVGLCLRKGWDAVPLPRYGSAHSSVLCL